MTSSWLVVASNVLFFYHGVRTSIVTLVPKKEGKLNFVPKKEGLRGTLVPLLYNRAMVVFDDTRAFRQCSRTLDVMRYCSRTHDDSGGVDRECPMTLARSRGAPYFHG